MPFSGTVLSVWLVNESHRDSPSLETILLINRGAYMPSGGIYKANIPITLRMFIVNINTTSKVLNRVRVAGRVAVALGVVATPVQADDEAINNGE